jgi:hypothetical protein
MDAARTGDRECGRGAPCGWRGAGLGPQGEFLRQAVKAEPGISLNELCVRLQAELQLQVSTSMVSRELSRLRLGRKKESPRQSAGNAPRDGAARDD